MMMVLAVHFTGAAFGLPTPEELRSPTAAMLSKNAIEAITIIGVNCFILISGFFGIRASWKGLVSFTGWCLFASLFVYALQSVVEGHFAKGFMEAFLVYSSTDLWFVPAYLALYLLSPLLNGGLQSLRGRQLDWFVFGLLFLNVYLGWWQGGKINPYGYNEMQMILMYVLGAWTKRRFALLSQASVWVYVTAYIACSAATFALAFALPSRMAFAYNSPFVIAASLSFFLCFATRKPFCSAYINWIASSAFMVYLLHKPPYPWRLIRTQLYHYEAAYSGIWFIAKCLILFAAVFGACILIDKLRLGILKQAKALLAIVCVPREKRGS